MATHKAKLHRGWARINAKDLRYNDWLYLPGYAYRVLHTERRGWKLLVWLDVDRASPRTFHHSQPVTVQYPRPKHVVATERPAPFTNGTGTDLPFHEPESPL